MRLTIQKALQQGVTAHKAGKLQDAERLYRAILQSQPGHPDANHNLGNIAVSANKTAAALPLFKIALEANPKKEQFWLSYIEALIKENQFENAEIVIERAKLQGVSEEKLSILETKKASINKQDTVDRFSPPQQQLKGLLEHYQNRQLDDAEKLAISITCEFPKHQLAWKVLGAILTAMGRTSEAVEAKEKATKLVPKDAESHNNLGNTLQELGRLDEALASCKKAIALTPEFAEAHSNMGITLKKIGRLDEALASHNRAIALKPNFAEGHSNLGITLKELCRLEDSLNSYRQALALKPDFVEAYSNLGNVLKELGRLDEALASHKRAIFMKPNFGEAHSNLGVTFLELRRLDEALASLNQAIAAAPDYAEAHYNLGHVLLEMGKLVNAEASFNQAIALKSDYTPAHHNLLFLNASMNFDKDQYRKDAQVYANMVAEKIGVPFSNWYDRKSRNKLRVGFVCGDFREHPVGFFLEGLLHQLQSSNIELFAYPSNDPNKEYFEKFRYLFSSWKPIINIKDRDCAQMIYNDGIDILIDLSGHTRGNRLSVFGWKPAPVQITWLGYFASTGLPEIDYILGDPYVTPEAESGHFTEKIWQLPESYLCFTPPKHKLMVSSLPARSNGFVTFGCFNRLSKMTDDVVSVWADILHAVPHSKLYLKDRFLKHSLECDRIISRFARNGIASQRLLMEGASNREEYLASYHNVDIALSPFPYGGGTTSIEGLWMGVPVICMRGHHFLSHLGESIAHNANLSDWIAIDSQDYVSKAIKFSSDLGSLEILRINLREALLKTPICDVPRFANFFKQALWGMKSISDHQRRVANTR